MEKLLIPLALLPIVAGYVFASAWEITRYSLARSDGQELYFKSAYYGYALALLSFSVLWLTDRFLIGLCPARGDCFLQLISIAIVSCLLLAKPFACYLNLFTDSDIYWQITLHTELEKLLLFSVLDSKPIMVSLSNNKVYIGYAVGVADPSHRHDRKWIQLFLILSGYRDAQSKVHYTLNYTQLLHKFRPFAGYAACFSAVRMCNNSSWVA